MGVGKDAFLYVGVLDEFFVDTEGALDRLVLQGVARRPIEKDKPDETIEENEERGAKARFYPVDGDSFVLRYSEIVTLNIQYVRLTPDAPPDP